MKRIAWLGVIITLALLLIGGGLIAFVQLRDSVTADRLTRSAEPRVFWGGGQTDVALRFTPPVDVVCPPIRRAANVLLLIDKSDSMVEDNAFASAVAAAQAYIDTMDFTASRAGVVFFDSRPQPAAPLSPDAATLRAALVGFSPSGTTDIAAALAFAETALADAPPPPAGASPLPAIVVLLTDGQADDSQAAQTVGRRLKDNGLRLITIGVGQADNAFLLDLASTPTDHFEVADPGQLPALYAQLAAQLKSAVAFNLDVREPVNDALSVVAGSVAPPAVPAANELRWNAASVGPEGATFRYQATIEGFGLKNVNSGDAVMAYTDCAAGPLTLALPPGPHLLVLPPGWLALLLLLLPLLPLVFMAFFRRAKPAPPDRPAAPAPAPLPEPEPADLTPAWLTHLTEVKTLSESISVEVAAENWTPTLIIGVGPVGRVVLPQIAQTLRGRFGAAWPREIRLLQIDVQPKDTPALKRPDYLAPEQWVLLEPDLEQVRRNLDKHREQFDYLDWYAAASPGYERARGRMAVFYDLKDGADQSRLWQALNAATRGLTKPKLRLVGSTFDDTASGALVDLARLVQIISGAEVDVEMWLSLPVKQDWSPRVHASGQKVRQADQAARTLATLRELERFQRNAVVPFHYVAADHRQMQLHDDARMAVIQTLFLFEPAEGVGSVADHLTTLTDALLAVLPTEAQQAVTAHLAHNNPRTGHLINEQGIGMACSLGAFAIRLPLESLAEALSWRVVHDLLYDTRVGLLPVARLDHNGNYERVELYEFRASDNPQAVHDAATAFVGRFAGRVDGPAFRAHVAHQVAAILNGEGDDGGEPVLRRVGGLARAQAWIQSVRAILMLDGHAAAAAQTVALEDRLFAWQNFLLEELRPEVDARRENARAALSALAGQSQRQWVVPEGLDWGAYRDRIRPWTTGLPTTNAAGEPLLRAGQRFGWYVDFNEVSGAWQAHLLIPPGTFVWREEGIDLGALAVARAPGDVLAPLYDIAYAVARNRAEIRGDWVLDVAAEHDAGDWLRRAAIHLKFNDQVASRLMGGGMSEAALLVAPQSERANALRDKLAATPGVEKIGQAATKDATTITLLRVRDRVPLKTLAAWDEEAWERQVVLPTLYVWRGEQRAAEIESDSYRLSPMFVGWLERDPQLVDRLARAYLFGLYRAQDDYAYLPGLGQWPAATIGQALDNLLARDGSLRPVPLQNAGQRPHELYQALDTLDQAIESERLTLWATPGRHKFLRETAATRIAALSQSSDQRERDLAYYLQNIVQHL